MINYRDFLTTLHKTFKDNVKNPIENEFSYNIFQVLGIETKEVLACRFIGSLLNSCENHKHENIPLKIFLKTVLKVQDEVAADVDVALEEIIDKNRRVDIVIRNGKHVYPIEVKIWAGDQYEQIGDYYDYYFHKLKYKDNKIYYLTPTGWKPSDNSIGKNLRPANISCISFKDNITEWLNKLIDAEEIDIALKSIIIQYLEVISIMCKSANKEKSVIEAIGLNNGFNVNDNLITLISLLKLNGDTNGKLQRIIQKSYLSKYLDFDKNKYILVHNPDESDTKNVDTHTVVCIGTNEPNSKIVAYVCVHTNLYIRCKKLKENHSNIWKDECWAYIQPENYKKQEFPLSDCENVLYDKGQIKIDNLLNEIATE